MILLAGGHPIGYLLGMLQPFFILAVLFSLTNVLAAEEAKPVDPCSVSVLITNRTNWVHRTYTNALETFVLNGKGLDVCQDDGPSVTCRTEFRLELLYYRNLVMRNVTIFRGKKRVFSQDYDWVITSQKLLKTIPTCAELQKRPVLK